MEKDSTQAHPEREGLLTLAEVADLLSVHRTTVWRWTTVENRLAFYRFSDGTMRVSESELQEFLKRSDSGRS